MSFKLAVNSKRYIGQLYVARDMIKSNYLRRNCCPPSMEIDEQKVTLTVSGSYEPAIEAIIQKMNNRQAGLKVQL